ncbi:MAG: hypothetical protein ACOY90_18635 [Candidatus Zhuqueibacterota bacterium]
MKNNSTRMIRQTEGGRSALKIRQKEGGRSARIMPEADASFGAFSQIKKNRFCFIRVDQRNLRHPCSMQD